MLVRSASWQGRRVLVTGHTGFKGGWLSLWLKALGAEVTGFALAPPSGPSLFDQVWLGELVRHVEGDIREPEAIDAVMRSAEPQVVFHLAAQPLVRQSYDQPVETFATNVMGTAHVLDACRRVGGVEAVVCVTSDKCYENREWPWAYRECDPMGGHDPYSASKGAAELVIAAFRRSFFQSGCRIASVRAGNVIGGGDWAADRLVPDIIRALQAGEKPVIRSPDSVRPWQHVLDALSGYLLVAEKLMEGRDECAAGWNFGPSESDTRPVRWIVERLLADWGAEPGWDKPAGPQPHEAVQLRLDSARARAELGWEPQLDLGKALKLTAEWHKAVHGGADARAISLDQIAGYGGREAMITEQVQWA